MQKRKKDERLSDLENLEPNFERPAYRNSQSQSQSIAFRRNTRSRSRSQSQPPIDMISVPVDYLRRMEEKMDRNMNRRTY